MINLEVIGTALDGRTFMVSNAFASALASMCLLIAWSQMKHASELLWWAFANMFGSITLIGLTLGLMVPSDTLILISDGGRALLPAMFWIGARRFNNLPISWFAVSAGLGFWALMMVVPVEWPVPLKGLFAVAICWAVFMSLAVYELWSSTNEDLALRKPLVVVFGVHAAVYVGVAVECLDYDGQSLVDVSIFSWLGILHIEDMFFAMCGAVVSILLRKEQSEQEQTDASKIDVLTGAVNRNHLFTEAERLFNSCQGRNVPFSMIMFDLDHFKTVNDTQGHLMGDRVLRSFSDTVKAGIRSNDLFGRYGGEEFNVFLPDTPLEAAYIVAERIRMNFAENHVSFEGIPLQATVSAGVVSAKPGMDLTDLIALADRTMYRAKNNGRNRVECDPKFNFDNKDGRSRGALGSVVPFARSS
ncbi:MAG: GGDEF domain-containing protein [Rhodobacteraceae bacterium]|nr:GGDEF domain-containing protein [Paracoccaceae bacterium]